MAADYTKDGEKLLAEMRPRSLLCIGPDCTALARSPHAPPRCLCLGVEQALAELPALGRFDFAFVSGTLERLPKSAGMRLLASLRDLHAARFVLVLPRSPVPTATPWSEAELLALGLSRVAGHPADSGLYQYDLHSYKPTPDWLNPRFWAHPERWDKDWW